MRWRWILLSGLALAVVGAGVFVQRTAVAADVGAAAMAKVECSCVFVDGRTLASCRADDPPGFESIAVTVDENAKTVTGSVFGLIKRRASYQADYGCVLEP